jgi:hypothetical protein
MPDIRKRNFILDTTSLLQTRTLNKPIFWLVADHLDLGETSVKFTELHGIRNQNILLCIVTSIRTSNRT